MWHLKRRSRGWHSRCNHLLLPLVETHNQRRYPVAFVWGFALSVSWKLVQRQLSDQVETLLALVADSPKLERFAELTLAVGQFAADVALLAVRCRQLIEIFPSGGAQRLETTEQRDFAAGSQYLESLLSIEHLLPADYWLPCFLVARPVVPFAFTSIGRKELC